MGYDEQWSGVSGHAWLAFIGERRHEVSETAIPPLMASGPGPGFGIAPPQRLTSIASAAACLLR